MKAEYKEGPEASKNFEKLAKTVIRPRFGLLAGREKLRWPERISPAPVGPCVAMTGIRSDLAPVWLAEQAIRW